VTRGPAAATALLTLLASSAWGGEFEIQNNNDAGVGFNDPTGALPVGLNFGTTRGDQALIVFDSAAAIWGAALRSAVPIVVDSAFISATDDPRFTCSSQGFVLGYARLTSYEIGAGLPDPDAGYVVALANAIVGQDLTPGQAHILARFNGDLGTAACTIASWSFTLDGSADQTVNQVSLLTTLLHEFGHGLGFISFVTPTSGALDSSPPSIFDVHIFDVDAGVSWADESTATRNGLITTPGSIGFDGEAVRADLPVFLGYPPLLFVSSPDVDGGAPTPVTSLPGLFSGSGPAEGALAIPNPPDACTDLAAGSLTGKVALILRGGTDPSDPDGCKFWAKTNRAAAAGAVGVVIYNNVATPPLITMQGSPALPLPAVFISQPDGQALQAQTTSGTVTASLLPAPQLSNADPSQTRVLLYTPTTVSAGSSVSHWNAGTFPKTLLMEPFIGTDTRLNMDFTPDVMSDLGWPVVKGLGVSVVKALEPEVPVGNDAHYIVAVFNRRATAIGSVSLDLTLPAGTTVVSAQGPCSGFPCALGPMDSGEVLLVVATLRAAAGAPDPFPVTATATPSSADPADNPSATVSSPLASGGDLQVTLTAPAQLTAGTTATFNATVTNAGPGLATGVTVTRTLAASGGASLQIGGGGAACTAGTCSLGNLASGASQTFLSNISVPVGFSGSVTLTAVVTSATPDPNAANNTASATASTPGSGGCSSTPGPVTGITVAAVALGLALRRRRTRATR